ncbi:MAG: hypothetical protein VX938_14190 [Myxococcota bacterium]|nr:hypothetical protein [Myxococcota bacterium]MEE2780479.1 hypothetical protein [Myxococcota bacterium]
MNVEDEGARARRAAANRFLEAVVTAQSELPADILDAARGCAEPFHEDHVIFAPGGTSIVALPTNVAIVSSGVARKFLLASYDRPDSLGDHIGHVFCDWARGHGCEVEWVQGDAIVAGKETERLPDSILEALERLGAKEGGVSLNESIAFGFPKPAPGAPDMNIGDLLSEGRIRRRRLKAASEEERQHTQTTMGWNPGCYRRELQRLGYLRPESFGLSYSWWGSPPNYGIVHEAKRILEDDAAAWHQEHGDALGRHRVVMQPATPSPALGAIALGPMMAVLSLMIRDRAGDHTSFAEMGVLQLIATCEPSFSHPWMDVEGVLVNLDRTEREGWPWVQEQMNTFESLVPMDLRGRMSAEDSHRLLTEGLGWPQEWRSYLDAMTIFEDPPPVVAPVVTSPTASHSASEAICDFTLYWDGRETPPLARPDLSLAGSLPAVARVVSPLLRELGGAAEVNLLEDESLQEGLLPVGSHLEATARLDRVERRDDGTIRVWVERDLRDPSGNVGWGRTLLQLGGSPQSLATRDMEGAPDSSLTIQRDKLLAGYSGRLGDLAAAIEDYPRVLGTMALAHRALGSLELVEGLTRTTIRMGPPPEDGETVDLFVRPGDDQTTACLLRRGAEAGEPTLLVEQTFET